MRTADGTLVDLTAALNEAIAELGNPVADADRTLVSATSQLNELLAWAGSSLPPADGTLASTTTTYNDFVNGTVINWRLQIATRYTGTGASPQDGHRPQFIDEYEYITWTDKTGYQGLGPVGKRPKMQAYIIEAEVTESVYTALEGDNKYLVFTAEPIIEEV